MIRKLLIVCLAWLAATSPATAQIVMRLYAKNYVYGQDLTKDSPHTFAVFTGIKADGSAVNEAWGFYPAPDNPSAGFWDYVVLTVAGGRGSVIDEASDLLPKSTPYLQIPVSDAKFAEMEILRSQWSSKSRFRNS